MPENDIHSDDPMDVIQAVREKIYIETQGMNHEEFTAYIRKGSERTQQEIAKIRANRLAAGTPVKLPWE